MKILFVEDDIHQANFVSQGLKDAEIDADLANNGHDGLVMASSGKYDVIILDRMLPQLDGLSVLRELRKSGNTTPVLILSALGDVDDRVEGLKAGGDDYLVKPFAMTELVARLDAVVRRTTVRQDDEARLRVGDIEMDLIRRIVIRAGQRIELKHKEMRMLEFFMRHPDQVITRSMLLEGVWDYHFEPATNLIDVHISNLRNRLDIPGTHPVIHTVRGVGYRFGTSLG